MSSYPVQQSNESEIDFDTPIDRTQSNSYKWTQFGDDVLPMWVADMDFRTAPQIIQALHDEVDHGVLGYSRDKTGLAETVVERLEQRYGWSIEPEWLVWVAGVVPALAGSCRIAGENGDELIVNPPIYYHFLALPEQSQRNILSVPLKQIDNRWTYDLEAIRAAITPRTRALLMCSPHNPVGTVFNADELAAVGELCAEHNLLICSDEIHCELILDEDKQHVPMAMACPDYQHNIITLMAPSKTFNLAGVNASFAIISDPALREKYAASVKRVSPKVGGLAYTAALAAYRDSGDWHRQLLDYLRTNRDILEVAIAHIPGLSMPHVEATYLAWIDTSQLACDDPHQLFLQHGVGLSNGIEFGDSRFVRLNFACTRANLSIAIDRIKTAVSSLS